MVCYRGGRGEGQVGGSGWEARGKLTLPWDCLGWLWVPEVPAIGPNMLKWRKRHLPITGGEFQTHASQVASPWSHCVSHEYTGSAKLALKQQTCQPILVIVWCMCSVQV